MYMYMIINITRKQCFLFSGYHIAFVQVCTMNIEDTNELNACGKKSHICVNSDFLDFSFNKCNVQLKYLQIE